MIVVTVRGKDDETSIDRKRFRLEAESESLFVRERCSNFCPLLSGLTIAPVLFDGEDVEVSGCRAFCECSGAGGLLIADGRPSGAGAVERPVGHPAAGGPLPDGGGAKVKSAKRPLGVLR